MGTVSGKTWKSRVRDRNNCQLKPVNYDISWLDTIDRSLVVVWCDQSIGLNTNADDDTNTLMQLALIVNRKRQLIHTFNELNPCREFMKNVNNICLIVSGAMGIELIPLVHDFVQLHSIFIFCMNKQKYEPWAKKYVKVRGVYTDIKEICERLKSHFMSRSSSEYEQLQFDILSKDIALPTIDKREFPFIYPLLSKIILSNLKSIREENMIDYCRMEYTNDYQINLIDDFENNYRDHNPIWWFTRDSFFQKIINRALQTHDFYTLCMMNPFIKDLDLKLSELYRQQLSASPRLLRLYLSQTMSKDEFEQIKSNKGGLMCINQFLFANTEKAIELIFIEHQNSTSKDANNLNILFEISITQTNQSNVSYANIGDISEFVHEKEYLLSMSSIYLIEKIEALTDIQSTWCVHLTLVDKNDLQLNKLTQFIHREYLYKEKDISVLSTNITNKLSQFKSTPKLFEQALNSKTKQIRPILLHYNMGIIYDCLNEFNKAIDEYKYAINLTRMYVSNGQKKDSICLIPSYSNMGLSYQQLNRQADAFVHAFHTLDILTKDEAKSIFNKELSASSHFNLGLILDLQGKKNEARAHYDQALKYRREYLPTNHPDITTLQEMIASLSQQIESID